MTTFKSLITLVIAFVFILTSCQKDNMQDMNREVARNHKPTTLEGNRELGLQRKAQETYMVNPLSRTQDKFGMQLQNRHSRDGEIATMNCSTGVINDTNEGAENKMDINSMKCTYGDPFTGGDKYYYLEIDSSINSDWTQNVYSIYLDNLSDDLDLFVYSLDETGSPSECKATSITIGHNAPESITLTGPNPGYYLVVVDGWYEGAISSYSLELVCSTIEYTPCWDVNGNGVQDFYEDINGDGVFNNDDCKARSLAAASYYDVGADFSGYFYQNSIGGDWTEQIEFGDTNWIFNYYNEVLRDEWSVYLASTDGRVTVQIDMHTGTIISFDNGNAFASYEITAKEYYPAPTFDASVLTTVIHWDTTSVRTEGYFEQVVGSKTWNRFDSEHQFVGHLKENRRDQWSVYLRDESNDLDIQLDAHQKLVIINNSFVYDIRGMN